MKEKKQCETCYHYGKSLVTKKVECVIAGKVAVCPGDCLDYVPVKGIQR